MDNELILRTVALILSFSAIFMSGYSLYISVIRYKKLKNDYLNLVSKLEKLKEGEDDVGDTDV